MLSNNDIDTKKMILNKGYKLLLFFSVVILLSACKSSKNVVSPGGVAINKANEQLVEDILNAETAYKTISGKVSLEMIGGSKTSGMKLNSQLKIIRNDIIQLSLRAPFINTEVFRLDITPDSVYVIDRVGKRYAVESLKDLEKEKNIQFNYSNLEALFTNSLFIPGKEEVTKSDYNKYKISLNSGQYNLQTKDKMGLVYDFIVDSSDRITSTNISADNRNYDLDWGYSDFIKDSDYIYPTNMKVQVNAGKTKFSFVISYSALDINKELKVDRNLPSNYKRVSGIEIIKSYIK